MFKRPHNSFNPTPLRGAAELKRWAPFNAVAEINNV